MEAIAEGLAIQKFDDEGTMALHFQQGDNPHIAVVIDKVIAMRLVDAILNNLPLEVC